MNHREVKMWGKELSKAKQNGKIADHAREFTKLRLMHIVIKEHLNYSNSFTSNYTMFRKFSLFIRCRRLFDFARSFC